MILILCMGGMSPVWGQSLFELAAGSHTGPITLNGHVRALTWMGERRGTSAWEQKALYSEGALQLHAGTGGWGDAYADVRLRGGMPGSFEGNGIFLREAYVDLYLGPLDLRMGKQINVWGRSDHYSPVDNITPVNALFHSPDEDDMRLGNYLLTARWHVTRSLTLEGVWIPLYAPSVLPVDPDMDPRILINGTELPAFDLSNSGYAFRIRLDRPGGGVTLSWFDGYEPYPGLLITGFRTENNTIRIELTGTPFREQVAGLGFETAVGGWGVRGEVAWRHTAGYRDNYYRAWPDLRFTAGIDHSFGNLTLLFQYTGHYLTDYEEPVSPGNPSASPDDQMGYFNRMMFRQLDRMSHIISLYPTWSLFNDVAEARCYGEYNFTTREYLLYPSFMWKVSDRVRLTAGGQIFHGPRHSLYDLVRPMMNGVFLGMKVTF